MKDVVELADIMKGCAHPRRVTLLMVLKSNHSAMSLEELSEKSDVPYKTAAVHMETLRESGLVNKTRYGQRVEHTLTKLGEEVLEFMTCL